MDCMPTLSHSTHIACPFYVPHGVHYMPKEYISILRPFHYGRRALDPEVLVRVHSRCEPNVRNSFPQSFGSPELSYICQIKRKSLRTYTILTKYNKYIIK